MSYSGVGVMNFLSLMVLAVNRHLGMFISGVLIGTGYGYGRPYVGAYGDAADIAFCLTILGLSVLLDRLRMRLQLMALAVGLIVSLATALVVASAANPIS